MGDAEPGPRESVAAPPPSAAEGADASRQSVPGDADAPRQSVAGGEDAPRQSITGAGQSVAGGEGAPSQSASEVLEEEQDEEEGEEEEGEEDEEEEQNSSDSDSPSMSRRGSQGANLQAELNKQKILKLKQERETRRAALDTHHQYLIDFVAFYIDQKPKDVEEHIIDSQDYLNLMENFFQDGGTRSILFYYQDHDAPGPESGRTGVPTVPGAKKEKTKRVMVTNGTDIPMKGIAVYFFRPFPNEAITKDNIADQCYFGMVSLPNPDEPGAAITALNELIQVAYLRSLKINTSWVTLPDEDMAHRIKHRFLTAISHYSEFLADCKNDITGRLDLKELSNLDEISETPIKTADDVIAAAKNPEVLQKIEHTIIMWCKNIERVLATSKQMRKETDSMGPLAELAYWRNLMAKMCYVIQQTQEPQMINMIQVLVHAKSKVLRRWKDVDSRVSDEFHESKDNVRYMYALEKFCQPLYEYDPPGMIEHIASMMYTIRTIHTTSRYYNTCEKITALMVKISNQMVAACKQYLTNDGTVGVWDQDSATMRNRLQKCLDLYQTYRDVFEATKAELQTNAEGRHFDVSVNHIFGRFEMFCERLKKIIQVEEIFALYGNVHDSHIDGLDDISIRVKNLWKSIQQKNDVDPLDFRNPQFDDDFVGIRSNIDEIQIDMEKFLDASVEGCPTAMHGLRLMERFRVLQNHCLEIDDKLWYLFQFYHNEIVLVQQIYEAEKNETPTPRGYPPFAGKISWARHLYKRLEQPMNWFQEKTNVLKREGPSHTVKLFNSVAKKLIFYEILFHESWVTQCNSIYDALEAPILTLRGSMRQELVLNFDPFFRQIVEETEIIRKLELEVPDIAQVVYCKREKLYATYERIKGLLERFLSMKTKIPQDLAVLMRPIVKKVEKAFMPGVTNINWTSFKTDEYFNYIEAHQNELEEVINKVQEIIALRINQVLFDISHTMLLDIPDSQPVLPSVFMQKVQQYAGVVSVDLEYKSRVCERAVAELINSLLRSCDLFVPEDPHNAWLASSGPPPIPDDSKDKDKGTEKPLVDPSLIQTQMTKEEMLHIYEECRHVFGFYNQKCIEALQKSTRISLDILRGRTEEPQVSKRNPGKILNKVPLFIADLVLTIPTITLKPILQDMQQVLVRGIQAICDCLKRVILWGQSRRYSFIADQDKDPDQDTKVQGRLQHDLDFTKADSKHTGSQDARTKNSFKHVMDHKDVSKLVLMMQTVVLQAKARVQLIIAHHMHYQFLWKETRDEEVAAKINMYPVITEIEAIMRSYKDLDDEIDNIPVSHRAGPLEVLTKELKVGFHVEVKEWKQSYYRQISRKYKIIVDQIMKFIDDCKKELQIPIKNMNDLYAVMGTLIKIRENIFKHDSMLDPIEENYYFLQKQNFAVPEDEWNRAFGLRKLFNTLLTQSISVQKKICADQNKNRAVLNDLVTKFQQDLKSFMERYDSKGPMKEGLTVDEATQRLYTFQDEFDDLWERYTMCNSGEKLFGLTRNEYPELGKVKTELSLLQKMYSLFNDVLRTLNSYSELRWKDVDMTKVTEEMKHYKTRCLRLPKGLKEWPVYVILYKKIKELNDWCPLGTLMSSKGMKDSHWDQLTEVTGLKFDVNNCNFTLRAVMEAASIILKFKEEVEEICNQAIKEKEIEDKMKQLAYE